MVSGLRRRIYLYANGIEVQRMLKPQQVQLSWHSGLYDLVPSDHILRRIGSLVDFSFANQLFGDSYCRYYGRPAKEPELMLRLLFLQSLYGLSDAQMVSDAQVNLAYKWFLGLNPEDRLPDSSVLSRFRTQRVARTERSVAQILDGIVRQCVEKGLIHNRRLVVDATHIEADTKMKLPLDVLRAAANKLARAMQKHHPAEARNLPGLPNTHGLNIDEAGVVLVQHLETLVTTVRETTPVTRGPVQERLRKVERILADDRRLQTNGISSDEDTDARVGRKSKTHMFFGYKQHMAMLDGDEIITACKLTPGNGDDGKQLPALVSQTGTNVATEAVLADVAYSSKANLEELDADGITPYIPVNPASYAAGKLPDGFSYNKDSDQMICPAGHPSYRRSRTTDKIHSSTPMRSATYYFDPRICRECPRREGCYKGQKHGRSLTVYETHASQEAAKLRENDPEARAVYDRRATIEHKFAELKRFCGLKRARYRSLLRVFLQAVMACCVANAKRMVKLEACA